MTYPREPDKAEIDDIVRQIIELLHPLRIILFGSAARGELGRHSDIDIMVVMPEGTHRRHTAQDLYQKVAIKTPVDYVVATPSDLEKHREDTVMVYREALLEGKELYAA